MDAQQQEEEEEEEEEGVGAGVEQQEDGEDEEDEEPSDPAYQEGETDVAIKFKLLPVPLAAGDCVRWSWQVEQGYVTSNDIGFRVVFVGDAAERSLAFEGRLREHRGEYVARASGQLRLIWDNSYSWISDKTLTYICHKVGHDRRSEPGGDEQ